MNIIKNKIIFLFTNKCKLNIKLMCAARNKQLRKRANKKLLHKENVRTNIWSVQINNKQRARGVKKKLAIFHMKFECHPRDLN